MAAITMPAPAGVGRVVERRARGAEGGRRLPHVRPTRAVYWRRRLTVLVLLAIAALVAAAALDILGGGPLTAAEDSAPAASAVAVPLAIEPVARATYVVRSGDTLWTIARRMQPTGDVRSLVDRLAAGRKGRPLQPGDRIALP